MEYTMHIDGKAVVTNRPVKVALPYDGSEVATVYDGGREEV